MCLGSDTSILGLNGGRLYGIDPVTARCGFTRRELEEIRSHMPGRDRTLGSSTVAEAQAFRAHHAEQGMP